MDANDISLSVKDKATTHPWDSIVSRAWVKPDRTGESRHRKQTREHLSFHNANGKGMNVSSILYQKKLDVNSSLGMRSNTIVFP